MNDTHDCGNPVRITTRFGDRQRTNCGCGYVIADEPYETPLVRFSRLEQENATLRAELERKDKALKLGCHDWADDDTAIKELAKPFGVRDDDTPGYFKNSVQVVEELTQKFTTLRELAEKLAATVGITVAIARIGWGDRDAGISDVLDQADRNLASYRAACPGEGKTL
jgi:hypothetical protein